MNDDPLLWEPYDRHWIRLRGPWEVTWLTPPLDDPAADDAAAGHMASSRRVRLPASWHKLFGGRVGTARFTRRFQQPTNLDPEERLLITLCEIECDVTAQLNDSPLVPLTVPVGDPASAPCEQAISFEITHLLQSSNLLTLELTIGESAKDGQSCGLWQPVLLEIITLE